MWVPTWGNPTPRGGGGGEAAVPGVSGDPLQELDESGCQRGEGSLCLRAGLEKLRQGLYGAGITADNLVLAGDYIGDEGVAAADILERGEGVSSCGS